MNTEVINDEPFSFYTLITYVIEHIAGISLLLLAILIIIIVDYISRINTILFSGPTHHIPIPTIIPGGVKEMHLNKPQKMRKIKRR